MVVTATFEGGSTEVVTGYTYSPSGALATTDTAITISYGGKTTSVSITVNAKSLTGIEITTQPTKTTYSAGETFDPTGMVVTASYDNDTSEVVSDYTYSPTEALTTSDDTVTVSYGGETATVSITVLSTNKNVTSVTVDSVSATKDANNDWNVTLASGTTSIAASDVVVVLEDENATYTLLPEEFTGVTDGETKTFNLRVVAQDGTHTNYSVNCTVAE